MKSKISGLRIFLGVIIGLPVVVVIMISLVYWLSSHTNSDRRKDFMETMSPSFTPAAPTDVTVIAPSTTTNADTPVVAPTTTTSAEVQQSDVETDPYSFTYSNMTVEYVKHELIENLAGETCLAVYYEFTNNSDENKTFAYSFDDKVFQNGVELDTSWFHVNDESKNSGREIQPGTTVTVVSGFVLNESRDNVTLQIEPWISFKENILLELELELPSE